MCSPNDYMLLYWESMPCFRDESRVIAQRYFKENYRSSRLQQTVREKMRKFKSHKANFCFFAGTSFSLAKNFAFLSFQFLRENTADCFWKQIYLWTDIQKLRKGDKRFLNYFDFSTILLQTLTGHRFSFSAY